MADEVKANEYPKVMQCKAGSVVVANEEQEIALPSDYGGKAKGKPYAETLKTDEKLFKAEAKEVADEIKAHDKEIADEKKAKDLADAKAAAEAKRQGR